MPPFSLGQGVQALFEKVLQCFQGGHLNDDNKNDDDDGDDGDYDDDDGDGEDDEDEINLPHFWPAPFH